MLSVTHNLAAMNSHRQLNINTKNRAKATEKLATGYSINRAADDAAGLAISEKMRQLIRGLDQGTENAQDGVSWVQIGDGALNEAHAILQRMNELSVQALNGTNSQSDRDAIQQEFEQLQVELDRIGETTEFNELEIFNEHMSTYYQCEGSVFWEPTQLHVVTDGRNDLTIKYRPNDSATQETISITVPAGTYTTQELSDEIDSAIEQAGGLDKGVYFEYSDIGFCNVNYEGGKIVDTVSGSLSYLLYDMYEGGEFGALIGTTSFEGGYPLRITSENNTLNFVIQDFNGNSTKKNIVIPNGWYYKEQIIELLNNELQGTSVTATEFGTGIKLGSEDSIVTKFKGNMFKIDTDGTVNTSVFYDNVSYGSATLESGYFRGGYVLTSSTKDEEYNKFNITDENNTLIIRTNEMEDSVTIQIPNDKYSINDMVSTLQSLFDAQNLGVEVSFKRSSDFYALYIESKLEGVNSSIDIDTTCSAYNTLFIDKNYTSYGYSATISNETRSDVVASFTGSKNVSVYGTTPLQVVEDINDKFTVKIDNISHTITLPADEYSSDQSIADEINNQLAKNNITSIEASVSAGKIMLSAKSASDVGTISVMAVSDNGGMDAVFQGYQTTYTTTTKQGTGSITLDQPYDGTVDNSDNPLKITIDGKDYTVNLPTGTPSQDEITEAIENAIPGKTETVYNKFTNTSATGTTRENSYTPVTIKGTSSYSSWSVNDTGETTFQEGTTQIGYDRPASITLSKLELPDVIDITSSNNRITLSINNETQEIILSNKTYTANDLKSALQSKIDASFGSGYGGAIVNIIDNKIVLTARTDATNFGENTSLSCSTSNSTLLKELNTSRGPAKLTTNLKLADSITIDENSNIFTFTLNEKGNSKTVSLTLDNNTYTRSSFVNEINKKLKAQGIGVTASSPSGYLVLTSEAVGTDTSITYGTTTGGSSSEVIFGPLVEKGTAKAEIKLDTEDTIEITDSTNGFQIRVNNTDYTVTLRNGTYSRSAFATMLNEELEKANVPIQASIPSKRIVLETLEAGKEQSFLITYDNGGSSMVAIYGKDIKEYPGVDASFVDGKLKLETDPSSTISVSSGTGGGFQLSEEVRTPYSNNTVTGYSSTKHGTIDGQNLKSPVDIDEFADDLTFTYMDEGTSRTISITVDKGSYTFSELESKLQTLLDDAAGANELTVTVGSGGVVIQTVGTGINNRLLSPSGDFYEKIMCGSTEKSEKQSINVVDGKQDISDTFTVGRKDILGGVTIREGISDELSIDFTCNNAVYTLEMTLDPGEYSSVAIKNHVQEKLNEQLVANGFEPGLIEVGVGDVQTGVIGANDSKAINFKLNKDVAVPGEGNYLIDGIGGNAAFEFFYSTDGELIPAYITGNKDISKGVTILEGEEDLTIEVDGDAFNITFEPKEYTYDELLETLNTKLEEVNAPLIAEADGGQVKLSYVTLGKHSISIEGGARDTIFFKEHGKNEPAIGTRIQLSSESDDYIDIPRTDMSTTLLGLNTVCVTKEKYAAKALDRVGRAINLVSAIRSTFGSVQNRLEHAINNNENKHENTTAAESRIRDTDMSEEMVNLSKLNILQQVGQAMLSQSNSSKDDVIKLLQ